MAIQDPPMDMKFSDIKLGDVKAYTRSGEEVEFVVWPPLYLQEKGSLMSKGIAQFRSKLIWFFNAWLLENLDEIYLIEIEFWPVALIAGILGDSSFIRFDVLFNQYFIHLFFDILLNRLVLLALKYYLTVFY